MSNSRDCIVLKDISFYAYHGALAEEKILGQTFLVSLELFLDLEKAGETDSLADTINYAEVYEKVRDVMEGPTQDLLESLAAKIGDRCFHDPVKGVRVEIKKPSPPIAAKLGYVAVIIKRGEVH